MRTPRMMLSRPRPRNPGHSGVLTRATGVAVGASIGLPAVAPAKAGFTALVDAAVDEAGTGVAAAVDSVPAGAGAGTAAAGSAGAGAGAGGLGSSRSCARSRSSGVGVHRQAKSFPKLPVNPPVRTSAQKPAAATIVTAIVTRRTGSLSRRVATAQITNAMPTSGIARMGYSIPIAPPAIDFSRSGLVARIDRTTSASAITRSIHAARLKNVHHTNTSSAPRTLPSTPTIIRSGEMIGRTNLTNSTMTRRASPGHSRSGRRVDAVSDAELDMAM